MSATLVNLFVVLTAFAISANSVAPLISTLAGRLGIPASAFGLFIALQNLAFAASSLIGGLLKERLRWTNYHLMAAGLALISLALLLAPAALRSAVAVIAWIIPLGMAGGSVETFCSVEISELSSRGGSKNLNISQAFYSIGAFAAPQIVFLTLGAGLGWKGTFLVFGALVLGISLYFVLRSRREFRSGAGSVEPRAGSGDEDQGGGVFYSLLFLMFVYVLLENLTAAWLSYVFEVTYRLTARDAALALAAFWAAMILSRFGVVLLPDRWTLWPALLACSASLFLASCLLWAAGPLAARFALVSLLGFAAGPIWPVVVMTTAVSCRSQRRTAAVIGFGALGSAIGPSLGSLLLRFGLLPRYFLVLAAVAAMVLGVCLLGYRIHRRAAVSRPGA